MPKMIFKVCCMRYSERVKAMLEDIGLSVDYQDSVVSDYYAIAQNMSYLGADSLRKNLEKDPDIFRAEAYPAIGELASGRTGRPPARAVNMAHRVRCGLKMLGLDRWKRAWLQDCKGGGKNGRM